jgi:hypothetical protein
MPKTGRPRLNPASAGAPSSYVGFKTDDELKDRLQAAGARADRSLSGEVRHRVETTFLEEDLLGQALLLAYGPDNGGLIILVGEVLRMLDPRGQWRDHPEHGEAVRRGCAHLLKRLQSAPEPVTIADENSPEGHVDKLLLDLGDPGSRWAKGIRRRLGALAPLLIEMRRRTSDHHAATLVEAAGKAADALDDLVALASSDHLRVALANLHIDDAASVERFFAALNAVNSELEDMVGARRVADAADDDGMVPNIRNAAADESSKR